MARPRKDPKLRMDVDLRIPLTLDQKTLIAAAAAADQLDVATWVRPILLRAAQENQSMPVIPRSGKRLSKDRVLWIKLLQHIPEYIEGTIIDCPEIVAKALISTGIAEIANYRNAVPMLTRELRAELKKAGQELIKEIAHEAVKSSRSERLNYNAQRTL